MHVFVTGATGWVGSAVVDDLIAAGHSVLGLARSEAGAAELAAAGAGVQRGSLDDLDGLRAAAAGADAVIHTAFNHDFASTHDFSGFPESCEQDRRAIEALGESGRPLLVTGGLAGLAQGRPATEEDRVPPDFPFPRKSDQTAFALAARGVRAATVRLSPSVHGHGEHGFVPILIGIAREKGISAYIGDGANRWAAVHRLDAARVYRLALERGVPAGGALHGVAEEGVPFKSIAAVIGRRLGVPVVSLSNEQAAQHFGWFAMFAGADISASSAHTRALLGWEPDGPGLLADLDHPAYFDA